MGKDITVRKPSVLETPKNFVTLKWDNIINAGFVPHKKEVREQNIRKAMTPII